MAKANRRSRNVARKAKNQPAGFVSQGTVSNEQRSDRAAESLASLEAGTRHPVPDSRESEPRAERNRQNALHSTGPRTPEGKAASSRNACKHGLSIQRHVILHHEDPAAYQQLRDELQEIYQPQSRREDLSIDDIAQCRWALQRFDEAESVALSQQTSLCMRGTEKPITVGHALANLASTLIDFDRMDRKVIEPDTIFPTFEKIQRYRAHWDRRHQRALAEFDRAQRARRADAAEQRKQAEALRKEERNAATEQRKQELHELRLALAKEKLATRQNRTSSAEASAAAAAATSGPDTQTPTPGAAMSHTSGFVSSSAQPESKTVPAQTRTVALHHAA